MADKRAIVRINPKTNYVVVLCHLGHLIGASKLDRDFGGSLQAEIACRHEGDRWDRFSAKCNGAGHEHEG